MASVPAGDRYSATVCVMGPGAALVWPPAPLFPVLGDDTVHKTELGKGDDEQSTATLVRIQTCRK